MSAPGAGQRHLRRRPKRRWRLPSLEKAGPDARPRSQLSRPVARHSRPPPRLARESLCGKQSLDLRSHPGRATEGRRHPEQHVLVADAANGIIRRARLRRGRGSGICGDDRRGVGDDRPWRRRGRTRCLAHSFRVRGCAIRDLRLGRRGTPSAKLSISPRSCGRSFSQSNSFTKRAASSPEGLLGSRARRFPSRLQTSSAVTPQLPSLEKGDPDGLPGSQLSRPGMRHSRPPPGWPTPEPFLREAVSDLRPRGLRIRRSRSGEERAPSFGRPEPLGNPIVPLLVNRRYGHQADGWRRPLSAFRGRRRCLRGSAPIEIQVNCRHQRQKDRVHDVLEKHAHSDPWPARCVPQPTKTYPSTAKRAGQCRSRHPKAVGVVPNVLIAAEPRRELGQARADRKRQRERV